MTGLIVAALLSLFAFWFCYKSGERGFFIFDQSFVFDGAYRICRGQVPYRDFLFPFGPVVLWLQAISFELLGVNYKSYLVTAAVGNVVGTLCALVIVQRLFPKSKYLPPAAAVMTAVWFYAPFGTPWTEQTAFLFGYLALSSLVFEATMAATRTRLRQAARVGLVVLAGVLVGVAILSKQNAGFLIVPVFVPLVMVSGQSLRVALGRLGLFAIGISASLLSFAVWLVASSDPAGFWEAFFVIPSGEGLRRIALEPWKAGRGLLAGKGPEIPLAIQLAAAWSGAWIALAINWRQAPSPSSLRFRLQALLAIELPIYHNILNYTTCNNGANGLGFIGIAIVCGLALAPAACRIAFKRQELERRTPERIKLAKAMTIVSLVNTVLSLCVVPVLALGIVLATYALERRRKRKPRHSIEKSPGRFLWNPRFAALLVPIYLCLNGTQVALSRKVQDVFPRKAAFPHYCRIPGLESLRWGQPTIVKGHDIAESDVAALVDYLSHGERRFFSFPEFSLLYGLLGAESPHPLLWFDKGLTYPTRYDRVLDKRVVDSLKRHHVDTVVMEEVSWLTKSEILADFPLLTDYIQQNFEECRCFGPFRVLKPRAIAASPPAESATRHMAGSRRWHPLANLMCTRKLPGQF